MSRVLLILLSICASCKAFTMEELGYPEKWEGDRYKNAPCTVTRPFPDYLDGFFFCQTVPAYGNASDPPGQKLDYMINLIGGLVVFDIKNGGVSMSGAYYPTRTYHIWDFFGRDFQKSSVPWRIFDDSNVTAEAMWETIPYDPDVMFDGPNVDFWKIGKTVIGATENPIEVGMMFDVERLSDFRKYPFKESGGGIQPDPAVSPLTMGIHERYTEDGRLWVTSSAINTQTLELLQTLWSVSPEGVRKVEAVFKYGQLDVSKCEVDGNYAGDKSILPGYSHGITSTKNYIIIPLSSTLFNPCRTGHGPKPDPNTGIVKGGWPEQFEYDGNVPLRFILFDKRTQSFLNTVFKSPPGATWYTHQFNSYEQSDGVIVSDLIVYEADVYVNYLKRSVGLSRQPQAKLWRYRIDVNRGTVTTENMIPQEKIAAEFCQVNHRFDEAPYKYGYLVANPYSAPSGILKIDVNDHSGRQNLYFNPGLNVAVLEPTFVPRPNSQLEDDGVLLVRGVNATDGKGLLFVVHAGSMTEIARATCPIAAPFGFHNRYYSRKELGL